MADMNDFNAQVVAEFRANGGKVGGGFAGMPMALLTTTGAKSGRQHVTPLVCLPDGDGIALFASMGGAPVNPAWYHNIVANSAVTLEYGTETYAATAEIAERPERDRLYAIQAERYPQFAEYEAKTTRVIPVVVVRRVG